VAKRMDALLFLYYQFIREYHREPDDFWDLFDGIDSIATRGELEKPEGK